MSLRSAKRRPALKKAVPTPTFTDLPVHLLTQRILEHVSLEDRAAAVSLVNKEWHALVKQCSHRPLELLLRPENFSPSFMAWHLTDTSLLRHVGTHPPRPDCDDAELYEMYGDQDHQESMQTLLSHLAEKGPALDSMEINPTALCRGPEDLAVHSVLPLLGALRQLESLVLSDWRYTWGDVQQIKHLSGLQNLQSLELLALQATAQPGSELAASGVASAAGRALQDTLPTLAALTCLHMVDVDCRNVLPWGPNVLTNIKSLIHDIPYGGGDVIDAPADVYSIEDMTGLERLWMRSPQEEPVWLTNLANLRELTYTNAQDLQDNPLLISGDAALTRLTLHGYWDDELSVVLPLATLRNVKELTLDCRMDEPYELPAGWRQLTSLTRLCLALKGQQGAYHDPCIEVELSHLEQLEVTYEFEEFEGGLQPVQWLLHFTPRLTRLRIAVHNLTSTGLTEGEALQRLRCACQLIGRKVLGVDWSEPTVTKSYFSTGHLDFAVDPSKHAERVNPEEVVWQEM